VRVGLFLVVVWAAWVVAWIAWAGTITEWHKPAANEDRAFEYLVWMVMFYIVVVAGLFAAVMNPGWGAIGGGLLVTLVAQWVSRMAVDDLQHWGPGDEILERGSSWVPFDDLDSLPFLVLLGAGVLLVVGGIIHLVHQAHDATPHAGAAT
jgi:hypothetical protein